ncbi:hypothetical protein A11A3_02337 [Alcanivorax hongdengensis A-11-3]|uniref:ABC transporter substrate-binding protein n=1 Tax=Alcanivorax hongdengensis A-11-3 TaxID=1177179 RepID=L0WIJ8_9GAMM|nr:hypothetical protein [Alcanivorax hongdengensis]EKF75670.1 hypothetical protein A11A3_02337 [Alcanivorax hongdengensis A-11-3]
MSAARLPLRFLFLGCLLCSALAVAEPLPVGVMGDDNTFRRGFESALQESSGPWVLVSVDQAQALVAIGDAAFERALKTKLPVLGVYISRPLANRWQEAGCQCSAIWAGVSLDDQLAVIRTMMPLARKVGVVVSPNSAWREAELAVVPGSVTLKALPADTPAHLGDVLRDNLNELDAVLLPVDDQLLDAGAAKLVLLTSYRRRRPVFGPDLAFVNAGSVASAYASGADLVAATRQQLQHFAAAGRWLPSAFVHSPSLSVNEHVAGSFDLRYRDSYSLEQALGGKP